MSEVTQILQAMAAGDPHAASQLLPLVYDELRKLAAQKLAQERPGQTLQPAALVHEAYLRLVGPAEASRWKHHGHFFAAVAEAMRHILVDNARRKRRLKHGGGRQRVPLDDAVTAPPASPDELLALDEALTRLAAWVGPTSSATRLLRPWREPLGVAVGAPSATSLAAAGRR
ncbi:MAG TPA: ECF-type sigma factor [Gemmataceae bacterium]|nr:ECF-type sigma factor [Gemmataceae bacterium]